MNSVSHKNTPQIKYTATMGFFDGVHRGHRYLIEQLKNEAKTRNQESMIITFPVHPRKVLHSGFQPKLLTTLPEKLTLLKSTGVDKIYLLDFTEEIATMTASDFMRQILKTECNVSTLLVGHDHRFGNNREHEFSDYKTFGNELNMEVIQAACFYIEEAAHISSSQIRHAVEAGNISYANKMLGYRYTFTGKVVNGFKVGRKIGFPTANLLPEDTEKMLPGKGVYAVEINFKGAQYLGMLNIGSRPTLNNGDNISIEVHILNFDEDIYTQTLEIRFIEKIRDEKRFGNIQELISQLEQDREKVRKCVE